MTGDVSGWKNLTKAERIDLYDTNVTGCNAALKHFLTSRRSDVVLKCPSQPEPGSCQRPFDLTQLSSPYRGTTANKSDSVKSCGRGADQTFFVDLAPGTTLNIGHTSNSYDSKNSLRWGGDCPGKHVVECKDYPDTYRFKFTNNVSSSVERAYFVTDGYGPDLVDTGAFTLSWNVTGSRPILKSVSLVSSNQANSVATEGDRVALTMVSSLPLDQPAVEFKSGGKVITDRNITCTGEQKRLVWTCTFTARARDQDGLVTFTVLYNGTAGVAGEPVTNTTDKTSITVDGTSPSLSELSLSSSNAAREAIAKQDMKRPNGWDTKRNAAKAMDTVTLSFVADEVILSPTIVFKTGSERIWNTSSIQCEDWSSKRWLCRYTTHVNDTNGIVSFAVTYKDAAGNIGKVMTTVTDGTSVIYDNAKPQATRLSLVSSNDAKNSIAERRLIRPVGWDAKRNVAKANNVVTLHIVAEEFVQTPHVVFSSGNGSISDSSVTYTDEDASNQERANKAWSCKFITHRSDTEGLVTFRVVLTDAAGNQGGPWSYVTDGTSVIVDTTAPTLATVSINSSNNAQAAIAAGKMQLPQGWDKNRNVAIKNDVVTLTVKASEFIHAPICYFKAGGKPVKDRRIRYNDEDTSSQAKANKIWTCKYTAHPDDAKGIVSFIVHFKDAARNRGIPVVNVTDGSSVIADKIGPTVPQPEPEPEPQPEPEPYSHCTAADADKNGRVNIEGK